MPKYRKRPVVIDAIQWTGHNTAEVVDFGTVNAGTDMELRKVRPNAFVHLLAVDTLEGSVSAGIGDWIIKGVRGEFYPCKPEIFAATYEAVNERLEEGRAIVRAFGPLSGGPVMWNPWNKVVQDHRDGSIDQAATDRVRKYLGLPVPWRTDMEENLNLAANLPTEL